MKAPDKIYVKEFDEGISQMWSSIKATVTTANAQHEYIRKDALMELLLSLEARYSVFYLQGKVIRDVIDKIDSL